MAVLAQQPTQRGSWAATRWSLVRALDAAGDPRREAAWEHLVVAYRRPMELYVCRVMGRERGRPCSAHDAAAIVQDFLGECVAKEWLSRADPTRGPFRAFLQVVLRRYTHGRAKHEGAQRRTPGGGARVLPLLGDETMDPASPEERGDLDAFDRTWAEVAVERSRERLAKEHARYLEVVDDLIRTGGAGSPDLAERVGVRAKQLPVLRHRAVRRFARIFEEELAATVGDAQQFRDEWRALAPYLP